jgi:glycosyltransferase involved in cell wall biosynthesis
MHPAEARLDPPGPLVSIVTVSLNAARSISDTLVSVYLQQAPFEIEHVCVDGGSRDGTRDIIDRWAARSPRIRRVFEPDKGIFDAMNKGLRASRGEYVLFLNADDFLAAPDALARAMTGIAPGDAGNPGIVAGNVSMGKLGQRGVWRRRRVPRVIARRLGTGCFALHQGMLAKRALLEGVGGFDARQRYAADVTQYYDLERVFKPSVRVVDMDVAFMQGGGNANASSRAMWRGTVETYRFLRRDHGRLRSLRMVASKTVQSVTEIRYGCPPNARWFAAQATERIDQPG